MTRKQFLDAKIPNFAYCAGGYHRSPSTQFSESLHITNSKIKLNLWWRCDNTASLSLFDCQEKNEFKQNQTIIDNSEKASMKQIFKKCTELMNESNNS